jgi:hypothetical protein
VTWRTSRREPGTASDPRSSGRTVGMISLLKMIDGSRLTWMTTVCAMGGDQRVRSLGD